MKYFLIHCMLKFQQRGGEACRGSCEKALGHEIFNIFEIVIII